MTKFSQRHASLFQNMNHIIPFNIIRHGQPFRRQFATGPLWHGSDPFIQGHVE